jgi:hypothetical protein
MHSKVVPESRLDEKDKNITDWMFRAMKPVAHWRLSI